MNDVKLLGNITHDIELRTSATGKTYAYFTIATSRKDKTQFVPVVAFSGLAEWFAKYFKKGSRVAISGHIEVSGKEQNYRVNIVIDEAYFAEKASHNNTQAEEFKEIIADQEDLPFQI